MSKRNKQVVCGMGKNDFWINQLTHGQRVRVVQLAADSSFKHVWGEQFDSKTVMTFDLKKGHFVFPYREYTFGFYPAFGTKLMLLNRN